MSTITSYPGVYIQENASPALSVSRSATAVPLICMNETFAKEAVRFNSYLAVENYLSGTVDSSRSDVAGLRAYFESGGGACYAVAMSALTKAAAAWNDTVTLVVANGNDISSHMTALTASSLPLFMILDGSKEDMEVESGKREATSAETEVKSPADADKKPVNADITTPYAAVYYPWLKARWTAADVPPSAVVAGLYCQNDRSRGAWKAPANLPLPAGYEPKFRVTDDLQGTSDSIGAINMIRTFDDRGALVWGARTLDDSDDWRYVPVRRLFNSVERDIKSAMNGMVFEPNTPTTWEKVRSAATSYLYALWQQGGLAGASESEAYRVQIGKGVTMSDEDIKQGKMVMIVSLAAVRPAEFVVIEFTQAMD
jgi:hypothetical protein